MELVLYNLMDMSMYTKPIGGAGFMQIDGYVYVH